MGLIADLLLFPVTGPVRGFQFVLEQIRAEADAQLLDEGRVQAELLNCSLRYDAGEISEQEYLQQEAELLDLLHVDLVDGNARIDGGLVLHAADQQARTDQDDHADGNLYCQQNRLQRKTGWERAVPRIRRASVSGGLFPASSST